MYQKNYKLFIVTVVSITFSLVFSLSHAISETCDIKITSPSRDGIEVGKNMNIEGTASIASGNFLWVLVHRNDFEGVWWPQNSGKIDPKTKEWKVSVTFGQPEDISWDFEIAVVVVKENANIELTNYRKKAMTSGDWRPIEMPPTVCAPKIIKVKKVKH
ncbi:hypothetical protein [Desulfobacter curvatus]|uniref:hypothetical protein n=1 Tax=Desulfobacter curvatus TaxID=2290 RepID=UPI0003657CD4|nr:hypothetical protein [Desulfobacter curvatus]